MAKHHQVTKAQAIRGSNTQEQLVERSESFDDNLLPDAEEIQKLHQIDPNIILAKVKS